MPRPPTSWSHGATIDGSRIPHSREFHAPHATPGSAVNPAAVFDAGMRRDVGAAGQISTVRSGRRWARCRSESARIPVRAETDTGCCSGGWWQPARAMDPRPDDRQRRSRVRGCERSHRQRHAASQHRNRRLRGGVSSRGAAARDLAQVLAGRPFLQPHPRPLSLPAARATGYPMLRDGNYRRSINRLASARHWSSVHSCASPF